MDIVTPENLQDLLDLRYQSWKKKIPLFTLPTTQTEGRSIHWDHWNNIIEIDEANLTATIERGASLGALAYEAKKKGLRFAPYTPDLHDVAIGDFYQQQYSSLTSYRFGQPKLHVMGLEVFLPNGEVIKTGGKTVKNVTGYDMNRFYLSSRDTLAVPLSYTIKLYSEDEKTVSFVTVIKDPAQLNGFIQHSHKQQLIPSTAVTWAKGRETLLFIQLSGMAERVTKDEQTFFTLCETLGLKPLPLPEHHLSIAWSELATLREATTWNDCFKIPLSQTDTFMNFLGDRSIDFWAPVFQGSFNLIIPNPSANLYEDIHQYVRSIKGSSNWHLDYQYNLDQPIQTNVWKQLKEKLDPDAIFNPI